jgi:hypothetical protein
MALLNPFRSVFKAADLLGAVDVALVATKYREVGRFTVPAGTAYAIGYGGNPGQDSAEGRFYADINSIVPGDLDGMVRLVLLDPQERVLETLFECHTSQLRTSATDRSQQLPVPEHAAKIGEDYSIAFEMKPDADGTVDVSACILYLDVTVYSVR